MDTFAVIKISYPLASNRLTWLRSLGWQRDHFISIFRNFFSASAASWSARLDLCQWR
jgi:hypothetical protein